MTNFTVPNFRNATVPFLNANDLLSKRPVYYVKFGLVTGPLGTSSQVLPDQYATGPIANASVSRKRYLETPQAFSNTFNAITYESSISQVQFNLQNIGGDITRIVTNYTIKNRICYLYLGFEGMDEADFQPIYAGQVNNFTKSYDATYYTFMISDPLKMLIANPILGGHCYLNTNFDLPTSNVCRVTSVANFAKATDLKDGKGARNYLRIDENLYSYTGISTGSTVDGSCVWQYLGNGSVGSSTDFGTAVAWAPNTAYSAVTPSVVANRGGVYVCVTTGTSAASGGPSGTGTGGNIFIGLSLVTINSNGSLQEQTHQNGAQVDNYVLYEGNPVDLMLQIILSTGTGNNYGGSGTNYDVLPQPQGVGIPYTLVNIINFERLRDIYLSGMTFSGYFSDQSEALKFIQENILRQAHVRIFTNKNGQMDMSVAYAPLDTIDAVTLDDTNIIGIPGFDANLYTGRNFFNSVESLYDYQPMADFFVTDDIDFDSDSLAKYQESSTLKVESKMVKSGFQGQRIIERMRNIYLKRFSNPPPVITIKAFFAFNLLNPGDLVYLNSSYIPNYKTGLDGGDIPILCEVLTAAPNFAAGYMDVTLLGIGFNQIIRYGRISPRSSENGGSFPVYTNASTAQRRYAFMGTKSGENAVMSDGSLGYYISP